MTKKEVKFSLFGDYINILHINKVCDFCRLDVKIVSNDIKLMEVKSISNKLQVVYENLFFKLGLMDLSLLILKKEVLGVGAEVNNCEKTISLSTIDAFYCILKKIAKNINYKLKKLRLSEIEAVFLTRDITVC